MAQSSIFSSYGYSVKASIIIDNKPINITDEGLTTIILSYDYDKNTMPVIYLGIKLESSLYNDFITNVSTAKIVFTLYKFDKTATSTLNEPYIHDSFIYITSSDPNYRESLEKLTDDGSNNYLEGYIGLIKLESLNDNNKLFNGIIKNSNVASIIHKFTKHMKMVIEPFDYNDIIDTFIIPPITSITRLLNWINTNYPFYKSGYRFFRDFNKTYLLSNTGVAVPDSEELGYNTVIINIVDPIKALSMSASIEINTDSKAYIINVDATKTTIVLNNTTDKMYNSIIGINSEGNTKKLVLDIPTHSDSTEKVLLVREIDKNFVSLDGLKNSIESTSCVLTITKTEIDSSILTPNKEYIVHNYVDNSEYNGRYILSYKKEILVRRMEGYEESVIFALRRVSE